MSVETPKMFVLIASGGQYDEKWSYPILASSDFDKLNAVKTTLESQQAEKIQQRSEYYQFMDTWRKTNPDPKPGTRPALHRPSFSGLDHRLITAEMREERKRIDDENDNIRIENHKPIADHFAQFHLECEQFIKERGFDVKACKNHDLDSEDWHIEAVDWV
jgi:hypothetical protein